MYYLDLVYVTSREQLTDFLTKPLSAEKLITNLEKLFFDVYNI